MSKSLVTGVDIGHYSIKAVVLKLNGKTYSLVSCKEIIVTDDIFADNYLLDYQKTVKKLKELKKSLPLFNRQVSLAIPDSAVISKVLHINSELDVNEQSFAIYQAFSQQSPLLIDELNMDFIPLPDSPLRDGSRAYQVYATRKEVVESRVEIAKKVGLIPVLVDMQMHSLVRVWQQVSQVQQRAKWMLVDIGYSQTTLCVDFINRPPFYQEIPLGTRWFHRFSATSDDAGTTLTNTAEVHAFNLEFIARLARQIQLFVSVYGAHSVVGIWLSGGGATLAGLADVIRVRLELACEVFTPLSVFSYSLKQQSDLWDEQHRFSTAAGLALRGIEWLESSHAVPS